MLSDAPGTIWCNWTSLSPLPRPSWYAPWPLQVSSLSTPPPLLLLTSPPPLLSATLLSHCRATFFSLSLLILCSSFLAIHCSALAPWGLKSHPVASRPVRLFCLSSPRLWFSPAISVCCTCNFSHFPLGFTPLLALGRCQTS